MPFIADVPLDARDAVLRKEPQWSPYAGSSLRVLIAGTAKKGTRVLDCA